MQHLLKCCRRWQCACSMAALLMLFASVGCSSWQSSAGLPGLTAWNEERNILKKVKNDPFPTPQQVGLK